jgi:hypothetical protein
VEREVETYSTFFRHALSVEYGSHLFAGLVRNGHPVGLTDVWMIAIREVFIPRPGGPIGTPRALRPPPITTLIIYVDDKAGKVVLASGY